MDIFLCYTITRDIFADSSWSYISMFMNAYYLLTHFVAIICIAFAGNSTTREATKIGFYYSRSNIDNMTLKPASNIIQVQFQSRKLILKNSLFDINWNILATVRIIFVNHIKYIFFNKYFYVEFVTDCYLSDYNVSNEADIILLENHLGNNFYI